VASGNWLRLAPIDASRASYSPLVVLVVIVAVVLLAMQVVHRLWHGRVRRAPAWNCGAPVQTPRMQDTAEGFGQPIRHIFQPFFAMRRELPSPFDESPHYGVTIADRVWTQAYLPLAALVQRTARAVAWLQQGRIATYLLYSFVTLLVMLGLVL
jgi:hypothetical protein